jgi:hypothetical protein
MENTYSVKVPTTLKLKHLPILIDLQKGGVGTVNAVNAISCVSGLPLKDVVNFKMKDIVEIYRNIMLSVGNVKADEKLPKTIKILDTEYYLVNPIKQPLSWVIDSTALVNETNPEMLCAFMYIEKGTVYGEMDENKNIINSVYTRAAIFKEQFPINTFLNLVYKYAEVVNDLNKLVGNEPSKGKKETTAQTPPFTWENLVLEVGKEFNMDFHDVLKINIKTFLHYQKVTFHNLKQRLKNADVN